MGNTLCKERVNQVGDPKNPLDRVLGRCVQICPNSFVKKDQNYWQQHVFETRPPRTHTLSYPKLNEWRTATLNVSSDPTNSNDCSNLAPIAPPRRKRSSQIFLDDKPGGFKEVFGELEQPLHVDTSHYYESIFSNQQSVSSEDFADFSKDIVDRSAIVDEQPKGTSLIRKVSKVGNKKSDKFFGENLSDCLSDEPIKHVTSTTTTATATAAAPETTTITPNSTLETKPIDRFVENNISSIENSIHNGIEKERIQTSEPIVVPPRKSKSPQKLSPTMPDEHLSDSISRERSSSFNQRAEFLMTLLDGYEKNQLLSNPTNASTGNEPTTVNALDSSKAVEEEIIVPIHSNIKHICDDEEKLKSILHTEKNVYTDTKTAPEPVNSDENNQKIEKRVNFKQNLNDQSENDLPVGKTGETSPDVYAGMEPVIEPIIVPKRKQVKHICSDDEMLHKLLHPIDTPPPPPPPTPPKSQTQQQQPQSQTIPKTPQTSASQQKSLDICVAADVHHAPKKPERDFEKYEAQKLINNVMHSIERPARKNRRSISKGILSTPPIRPERRSASAHPYHNYAEYASSIRDEQMNNRSLRSRSMPPPPPPPPLPKTPPKSIKVAIPTIPADYRPSNHFNTSVTHTNKSESEISLPLSQDHPININPILNQLEIKSQNPLEPTLTEKSTKNIETKNVAPNSNEIHGEKDFLNDNKMVSTPLLASDDDMNEIVNKVCNYAMLWGDQEAYATADDCSSQVKPHSKVATRKISLSRLEREKEEAELKMRQATIDAENRLKQELINSSLDRRRDSAHEIFSKIIDNIDKSTTDSINHATQNDDVLNSESNDDHLKEQSKKIEENSSKIMEIDEQSNIQMQQNANNHHHFDNTDDSKDSFSEDGKLESLVNPEIAVTISEHIKLVTSQPIIRSEQNPFEFIHHSSDISKEEQTLDIDECLSKIQEQDEEKLKTGALCEISSISESIKDVVDAKTQNKITNVLNAEIHESPAILSAVESDKLENISKILNDSIDKNSKEVGNILNESIGAAVLKTIAEEMPQTNPEEVKIDEIQIKKELNSALSGNASTITNICEATAIREELNPIHNFNEESVLVPLEHNSAGADENNQNSNDDTAADHSVLLKYLDNSQTKTKNKKKNKSKTNKK